MDEIRFIAATGALGVGVNASALDDALHLEPHFIAADAGSTDAGPFALGSGSAAFSRSAVKRDLTTILLARDKAKIPALIGSAGTAGGDPQVDWVVEIVKEIVRENGLSLRMGVIKSEQDKTYLEQLYRENRIRPLDPAPPIDEGIFRRSERIVGMMGVEPLQAALEAGADFVLAGRCSDSALYAAMPIMRGFPEGLAWHAGKVAECGTMSCVGGRGILTGAIRQDSAILRPVGDGIRATPISIAAHSLYEAGDPYYQKESSGTLDLSKSEYSAVDEKSVMIRNSAFIPAAEYTVKLEGAESIGYQSIMIGGIRDPYILKRLDLWLSEVRAAIQNIAARLLDVDLTSPGYHLVFHVYGTNGVTLGASHSSAQPPEEVGIVVEATAPSQHLATEIIKLTRQPFLHHGVPEWMGAITGFACLHNPAHIDRGQIYRFNLNHVALPRTKTEMFRTTFVNFAEGVAQ
ncbi:MAG: acyclic terpene utilization AtuA family protein [Caulobacteraceae bacterium]